MPKRIKLIEKEKLSLENEKKGLLNVSYLLFNKIMEGERENVMMKLICKFRCLRYEDLEEVYSDGCLVLWNKMMDKDFKINEKSIVAYLVKICMNIGMHYLRRINENMISLDVILEKGFEKKYKEDGMKEFFDVLDDRSSKEEVYEKLDKAWDNLKDVDRMILESYYVDRCSMEEIARKIGYKNCYSVKSRKYKVLKKLMVMMEKDGEGAPCLPFAA